MVCNIDKKIKASLLFWSEITTDSITELVAYFVLYFFDTRYIKLNPAITIGDIAEATLLLIMFNKRDLNKMNHFIAL
jgi:hypothetical protein